MKIIYAILLLSAATLKGQAPYVADWSSYGHTLYDLQYTTDTAAIWQTIAEVKAKTTDTSFQYNVPGATYYYRVVAGKDTSNTVLVYNILKITQGHQHKRVAAKTVSTFNVSVGHRGSMLLFDVQSPRVQKMTFYYYNLQGQLIDRQDFPLMEGLNILQAEDRAVTHGIFLLDFETYFDKQTIEILR